MRWYLRYALSYRDLEEMMRERGVIVDHTSIYRWVQHYARDPSLFALEAEARRAKQGLWSLPEAERMPPWEWRRRKVSAEDGSYFPVSVRAQTQDVRRLTNPGMAVGAS